MADLEAIDPARTVLMVLDMHRDVVADDGASKDSGAPEHAAKQNVVENIKTLLAAARKSGTPVLHIHHRKGKGARPHGGMSRMFRGLREGEGFDAGTRGMEVMPGLEPQDGDLVIEKERASAFAGTETDIVLRAMAIDTLILTGAWTNFSVESTARQATDMGYRVIVASDGTSSISDEWHNAAIGYALTWLCEIAPSSEIAARSDRHGDRTMRVRAALFEAPGAPLVVRTIDLEGPGPGDALVRIDAVGICGSDLHVVKGEWVRPRPMVLGHEGAGVVEAVGADVDGLAVGDRVILSWAPSCGECGPCLAGRTTACLPLRAGIGAGTLPDGTTRLSADGETIYRMTAVGALAERVVMPASGVLKLTHELPAAEAALLGCAALTGIGAAREVAAGDVVVVIGAGGVGQFCVQGARLRGATAIVAVDPLPARRSLARAVGATHDCDPADLPALLAALAPDGADCALEAVGSPATAALALASVRPGGRATLVGMPPAGARLDLDPAEFTNREKVLTGTVYGSGDPAEALPALLADVAAGRVLLTPLVGPSFPLERADEAIQAALAGEPGRVIVTP